MGRRFIIALVVLAAAWLLVHLWQDDRRRIERRLATLQKLTTKTLVETRLQGAGKAKAIGDLFAADFELIAEPENYATANRQDLIRSVMAYRSRSESLSVEVVRRELYMDPDGLSATHYAYVRFVNDLSDLAGTDTYPVRIEWVKVDGDWLIKKFEILSQEPR